MGGGTLNITSLCPFAGKSHIYHIQPTHILLLCFLLTWLATAFVYNNFPQTNESALRSPKMTNISFVINAKAATVGAGPTLCLDVSMPLRMVKQSYQFSLL